MKLPPEPGTAPLFPAYDPAQHAWGYIDARGVFVIPPIYQDSAAPFTEGLAFVRSGGKTICIDKAARVQFTLAGLPGTNWLSPYSFKEGFALVDAGMPEGRRSGFVTPTGAWLVPPRFSNARPFSEGLAAVAIDGKWGFVDTHGTTVIPPRYRDVSDFTDGRAEVQDDAGTHSIGVDGRVHESGRRSPGTHRTQSGPATYDDMLAPRGGFAAVRVGRSWGFVAADGRLVIPPSFDRTDGFVDGLARVEVMLQGADVRAGRLRVGYIDEKGTWIYAWEVDPPRLPNPAPRR